MYGICLIYHTYMVHMVCALIYCTHPVLPVVIPLLPLMQWNDHSTIAYPTPLPVTQCNGLPLSYSTGSLFFAYKFNCFSVLVWITMLHIYGSYLVVIFLSHILLEICVISHIHISLTRALCLCE